MQEPEIPQDEDTRLSTLRSLNVLDTPSEERFDRLTRMAKRMFDVPIALVSLIDENRQWFKSCIGLPVLETPRDISFCGHAILGTKVFLIPDATKDERFADNPLVTDEPNIRFYAGCPLRFTDGSRLGTLCIIDQKPRIMTDEDIEALKDIASTVERELAAVQLATLDELTNIHNRRGFRIVSQQSLNLGVRQNTFASMAYIDLDNFKPINDNFGHSEGDKVLTTFAEFAGSICRDSDILARLGGDEFVILFIDTSKDAAESIINRLKDSLNNYNEKSNNKYDISFSYGIIDIDPSKEQSIDTLLEEADSRMYEFKKLNK